MTIHLHKRLRDLWGASLLSLLALCGFLWVLAGHPVQAAPEGRGLLIEPDITDTGIYEESRYLYGIGSVLFYTNTMGIKHAFSIFGEASGATTVTFSSALGQTPPEDTDLPSFEALYEIFPGTVESGMITATAYDLTGATATHVYSYVLDGVVPAGNLTGPEMTPQVTVSLMLSATDGAGCGVAQMCLSASTTCSAWEPYAVTRSWTLSGADGPKVLYAWYRDYLSNTSRIYSTTIILDQVMPVVTVTAPVRVDNGPFTVSWMASDAQPGTGLLPTYTVVYRTDKGPWVSWFPATLLTRSQFLSANVGHTYAFSVTVYDGIGNQGMGSATTYVGTYDIYLPLLLRNYAWLKNGDFELGTLTGWTALKGGFNDHGSGLPQSVVALDGSQRALLGDPAAVHKSLPVGYGSIAQSFVVEKRYITMKYRVLSYDIFRGADTGRYYDTFEVSLIPPAQVLDSDRDARCSDGQANPTGGVVVPVGTRVIFCGGRIGTTADLGTLWDSGWKTVTLDLQAYQGQLITPYFTVWGREYDSAFYNDKGWYNTWAYVDDVSLHD